jgi:hypothetical protein
MTTLEKMEVPKDASVDADQFGRVFENNVLPSSPMNVVDLLVTLDILT